MDPIRPILSEARLNGKSSSSALGSVSLWFKQGLVWLTSKDAPF